MTNHVAPDPNRRPEDPNPPRLIVVDFTEGRDVADFATWVRPVAEPALLLSAVRNVPGLEADRYRGCDPNPDRPPLRSDPII